MVSTTRITHRVNENAFLFRSKIECRFSTSYGKPVDIWACGCMRSFFEKRNENFVEHFVEGIMAELATGQALFGR